MAADRRTGAPGPAGYAYVAGTSFSGSTLLSFLLNAHPEVTTIGEAGPAPRYASASFPCSCGLPVPRCPWMQDLARAGGFEDELGAGADWGLRHAVAPRNVQRVLDSPVPSWPIERARARAVGAMAGPAARVQETNDRMVRVAERARARAGAAVFVDATKQAARLLRLSSTIEPIHVVHLVRSPAAFVQSFQDRDKGGSARAAMVWERVNGAVEAVARGAGLPYLRVRHEDLVTITPATYRTICGFLGVEEVDPPDDYLAVEHHIVGNAMRLGTAGPGVVHGPGSPPPPLPPLAAALTRRRAARYGYR